MPELLAERPLIVSLLLAVLAIAFLWGWLQSGRKPLAVVGVVLLACIPVAWWIADRWVTDREQIQQLIYQTADAVEANDHDRVLRIIGDSRTQRQAAAELPRYTFTRADVGSVRNIEVIETSYPTTAEVEMTVNVEVSGGSLQDIRVVRRLFLWLEKRERRGDEGEATAGQDTGGWVVTNYEHRPLLGDADRFTTRPPES